VKPRAEQLFELCIINQIISDHRVMLMVAITTVVSVTC